MRQSFRGRGGCRCVTSPQCLRVFQRCRLSDGAFWCAASVTLTTVTGHTQGCHPDAFTLIPLDGGCCCVKELPALQPLDATSPPRWFLFSCIFFFLSVSCPQAPATALSWSTTWPAGSCTKNSASIPAKSGKVPLCPRSNTPKASSRWSVGARGIDLPLIVFRLIGLCHMIGMQRQPLFTWIYFSGFLLAILWATQWNSLYCMGEQAKLLPQDQGYGCFEGLTHNQWGDRDGLSQCVLDHHGVKTPELQGRNALELPMNGNYRKDNVADTRY